VNFTEISIHTSPNKRITMSFWRLFLFFVAIVVVMNKLTTLNQNILVRDLGLCTKEAKSSTLKHRDFVKTLTQRMEECKDENKKTTSSCKESHFRDDRGGGRGTPGRPQYSNCDDTAFAIFIHTTGIPKASDKCCLETGYRLKEKNKHVVMGIPNFISKINFSVTKDSMCYVFMGFSKDFHVFTLEFRVEKEPKGFYVFSSWSNFFTLDWFLGLENNMRSKMTKLSENTRAYDRKVDPSAERLRTKYGLEKFVEFDELKECLKEVALVLEKVTKEEIPLSSTGFNFSCRELNDDFKTKN